MRGATPVLLRTYRYNWRRWRIRPGIAIWLGVAALTASPSPARAEDVVQVSVKYVLDDLGQRGTGPISRDENVVDAIRGANFVLGRNGVTWSLELVEILDISGAPEFYEISLAGRSAQMTSLETRARANPEQFGWRANAVNIYLVNDLEDASGVCSLPHGCSVTREVVVIQTQGIRNDGGGWLHEIGHYLSLFHTFECFEKDCDPALCTGEGFCHGRRNKGRCEDVCPHGANVMSYDSRSLNELVFSPCQIQAMNWELYHPQGARHHVVCPLEAVVGPDFGEVTFKEALDRVCPGGLIEITAGEYNEGPLVLDRPVTLRSRGGRVTIR